MGPQKKRRISGKREAIQQESDAAITALADFVLDSLRHEDHEDLEPFEEYASNLRARVQSDPKVFCKRFINGYYLIRDTLGRVKIHEDR